MWSRGFLIKCAQMYMQHFDNTLSFQRVGLSVRLNYSTVIQFFLLKQICILNIQVSGIMHSRNGYHHRQPSYQHDHVLKEGKGQFPDSKRLHGGIFCHTVKLKVGCFKLSLMMTSVWCYLCIIPIFICLILFAVLILVWSIFKVTGKSKIYRKAVFLL